MQTTILITYVEQVDETTITLRRDKYEASFTLQQGENALNVVLDRIDFLNKKLVTRTKEERKDA